jgi:LPXTG-site transpeptidase (sortase) family protein
MKLKQENCNTFLGCWYYTIMRFPHISLRRFNDYLSIVVIGIALYILLSPFWPAISWRLHHFPSGPSSGQLNDKVNNKSVLPKDVPKENTLLIPRIDLTVKIKEGLDLSVLNDGTWRRPKTSTPDKGGNTVVVGHRFTYSGKSFFYNLDKVQNGDPIVIYWHSKQYIYTVKEIKVVPATEISVEQNTKDSRLTLYTCTPLWNPKDRLVIIAQPSGGQP